MQKKAHVYVYIAAIPKDGRVGRVHDAARQAYIDRAKAEELRRERYYVWQLLEYALWQRFGVAIETLSFEREESGRWHTPYCEFSLSHSDGLVAVALSAVPVGVDIQRVVTPHNREFAKRVLTLMEMENYLKCPEAERTTYLIKKWTEKEALFKMRHDTVTSLMSIETGAGCTKTRKITVDESSYVYTVAAQTPAILHEYKNIEL